MLTSLTCRVYPYQVCIFWEAAISLLLSSYQNWTPCPWRFYDCLPAVFILGWSTQTQWLIMWARVLQTHLSNGILKPSACLAPVASQFYVKKWLSKTCKETIARVLNLILCWICHFLPDSFDHGLIYSLLNLTKKCIRNSRVRPQLLHFPCEIPINTSACLSHSRFCSYCLAVSEAEKYHQDGDVDKQDTSDWLSSCSPSKARTQINYSCLI